MKIKNFFFFIAKKLLFFRCLCSSMSLSKVPLDLRKFCADCKEVYKHPRLLPCLHALCAQSILDMLKDARQNNSTPKCPICSSVVDITDLADLPPMGLDGDDDDDDDGNVIIEECIMCDQAGKQHCKTCNIFLCTAHADEHTEKKSSHQMFPTVARNKHIYECRVHARRAYTKYCMTCLEPVCDVCLETDKHSTHTVWSPDKAFQKLCDTVCNRPDEMEYFKQFEKQVNDTFSNVTTLLQHRHDEVLRDARTRLLAGLPDNVTMEVRDEQTANVHQWDEMARQKADEPLIFLHIYNSLIRRMPEAVEISSFSVDVDVQLLIMKLGTVSYVRKRQRLNSAVIDWMRHLTEVLVVRLPRKHPNGIAALEDMLVVSNCHTSTLDVISPITGKIVNTIGRKGSMTGELQQPFGVAVDQDGNIWVADTGNNRIQCFTKQGEFASSFTTIHPPTAIAILNNGNLAVSHNNVTDKICVIIYTQQGEVVLRIKAPNNVRVFNDVKVFNDELYVTASSDHIVLVSATTGTPIRYFGDDELKWCNGLVVTQDGQCACFGG